MTNHIIVTAIEKQLKKLNLEEVTVEYRKPPSYLLCFLNDINQNNDIIFIYKQKTSKLDATSVMMKDISKGFLNGSVDDENLTGQPLEVTVDEIEHVKLDESDSLFDGETSIKLEKNSHYPLSCYTAVEIQNSLVDLKVDFPIWILTDATDLQKSIVRGSLKKENSCIKSWVTVQGKLETDKLDIGTLLKRHRSYTSKKNDEDRPTTEVSCKINVESVVDSFHGDVFIHANWKVPCVNIPSFGASLSLELLVKVGEPLSPLNSMWQQLLLLQKYFDIVVKWKTSSSLLQDPSKIDLPSSRGIFSTEDIGSTLKERIIDALMSPQQWSTDYSKKESYKEVLLNIKNCTVPGMDLTGRLWTLLSESSTYEELINNTKLLFQQAKKCLTTKPFISRESKSKMAEAVRTLLVDPSANPQMMVEPLELLVEIGVESLKNNYIAAFVQSGIVKEDFLNVPNVSSFVTMDNPTWIETVTSYMIWLARIHSVAELIGVTQLDIKVTPDISEIIRRIFGQFLGENSPIVSLKELIKDPNLRFVTPISGYPGQSAGELKYEKWLMRLKTEERFQTITTCFLQTHVFPFPDSVYFQDDKNITLLSQTDIGMPLVSSNIKWFLSQFTSIVTKFR